MEKLNYMLVIMLTYIVNVGIQYGHGKGTNGKACMNEISFKLTILVVLMPEKGVLDLRNVIFSIYWMLCLKSVVPERNVIINARLLCFSLLQNMLKTSKKGTFFQKPMMRYGCH